MAGMTADRVTSLQGKPENIRNICIMAHVDHGKTSLADALVASNGIISQRMVGRIRYMDSRKDEIERGITMKSSCVSLHHNYNETDHLIHLIDSPGHVDFSTEVSTAVRLCDGTIIVVDVIEGVCAQTKVVLKQAWVENIKPILVLNKIDRLILETQLSPLDAYYTISGVLEQVNAYMAELYNTEVLGRTWEEVERLKRVDRERRESEREANDEKEKSDIFADWGIEDIDDSNLYFTPERGNVIFASAYDGWGFGIRHFASQFGSKLGMNKVVLNKTMFGDFYITNKGGSKRIVKGARDKRKNPLFVTLILDNIYKLYETIMIRKDKVETERVAESLGIKVPMSIMKTPDTRARLNHIISKWLPLAPAVLECVIYHLPSAGDISEERAMKLMCSATQRFDSLPSQTQLLKEAFVKCASDENAPLIVYVSKMVCVPRKNLPEDRIVTSRSGGVRGGLLTDEEVAAKRNEIRRRAQALENKDADGVTLGEQVPVSGDNEETVEEPPPQEDDVFVAFARVFSGTLKKGQKVYVLGPKHDPNNVVHLLGDDGSLPAEVAKDFHHISVCEVEDIYLLLGREMATLPCASAGCVVGIRGLAGHILKSATLSSTPACPPFTKLTQDISPILRVAVEPEDPRDLPKLRVGLKLLNQADPCVQVLLQDTGEYVIVTAGEVHLEKCIQDLREHYARIPIKASDPIVPFRETIVPPPTLDRLNEAIEIKEEKNSKESQGTVTISNKFGCLKISAVPLPPPVTTLLEKNSDIIKLLSRRWKTNSKNGSELKEESEGLQHSEIDMSELNEELQNIGKCGSLTKATLEAIEDFKSKLDAAFREAGSEWDEAIDQMWSFGPNHNGPNILLNRIKNYSRGSIWEPPSSVDSPLSTYDRNFVTGFQLATAAGPLCEEPMMGVCFIVDQWSIEIPEENGEELGRTTIGGLSGQVISTVKDTCRKAFQERDQRLMVAMYSCVVTVTAEVVGKMYAVIAKRNGRILDGDITEGSTAWNVCAYLPVVESLNIANELRKSTSGEAVPQLVFSHWETLDLDPFWVPQTEEELLHWGEKADTENVARKYMNMVRKRKGRATDEQLVIHAEKQRTLSKNK
ncbi:elongation factor-like GTPase 1 isoform X2 [Oratosquilla oratoria]